MTLSEYQLRFQQIIQMKLNALDTDRHLIELMKEMETQFQIPFFPTKRFKFEKKEVYDLYTSIYTHRSQLYGQIN